MLDECMCRYVTVVVKILPGYSLSDGLIHSLIGGLLSHLQSDVWPHMIPPRPSELKWFRCFGLVSTESGHPAQFVGVSQGSRLWEHNKASHYSPSWTYRMPQNFIQQGSGGYQPGKPFVSQGQVFVCLFLFCCSENLVCCRLTLFSLFFLQVLLYIRIRTSHWSHKSGIK